MSVRPCSLASSVHGFVVGWVSELGPAWVTIPTTRTLTAHAEYLGDDAAGLVAVAWNGSEPTAVYTQSDGTFVRRGDERPERIADIAHVLAAAGAWVALATREGILAGREQMSSISRRTDVRHLAVCPVPGGALVFAAGENDLGVIRVDASGCDEVTHRIDDRVTSLDAAGRGGRAAVVVGTETQVLAAELNGRGKMRGKLHAVLRPGDQRARVEWMVSEFVLGAIGEEGLRVERFEGGHLLALEDLRGPYGFAFQQGRVLATQIDERAGADFLVLRSRDRRGGSLDLHSIPCHPADSELRRRTFAARRIFEQLGAALATTGYRERGAGEVSARELCAKVRVGESVLQLDARLEDEGVELGVDVSPADPAPPPRSFARLARFFRRLTPDARAAREAMARRVEEVVGEGVDVLEAERSADVTSLTLHAREVPTAMELVRWLKALGEL